MPPEIESLILTIRGLRVILDTDLAALYGVTTKRFNEQVKRNSDRFPADFMFRLEYQELTNLRSQFATSSLAHGGRRYRPYVFTEHGAVMAANVLNSRVAIEASVLLVRTFIKLRTLVAEHDELKRRLNKIEDRIAKGFRDHEQELLEIRFAIAQLEQVPAIHRRRIGFESEDEG